MLEYIKAQEQIDYMKDLTKYAWLGQVINGLLGGKKDLYKEVTNELNKLVASLSTIEEDNKKQIEEWKHLAKKKGLKYTDKEVE